MSTIFKCKFDVNPVILVSNILQLIFIPRSYARIKRKCGLLIKNNEDFFVVVINPNKKYLYKFWFSENLLET